MNKRTKTFIAAGCVIFSMVMVFFLTTTLFSKAASDVTDDKSSDDDSSFDVTIYMYSPDLSMTPKSSDIYVFENGGSKNDIVELTDTYKDEDNDVVWLVGSAKLSYSSLGIIARDKAGTWDGGQDKDRLIDIDKDNKKATLWYIYGENIVTSKPMIEKNDVSQRYLMFEYQNSSIEKNPKFYSWTTGYEAKLIDFEKKGDGKWFVNVPLKRTCQKVDFVLCLNVNDDGSWDKDGGDHSIETLVSQNVVCARMEKGKEPSLSCPYNKGYDINTKERKVVYYYRDDNALLDNSLSELNVKIEIDNKEYTMKYNDKDKRFEYTSDNLKVGKNYYRYHINDKYEIDKFNDKNENIDDKEYSYFEYGQNDVKVTAKMHNQTMDYNQNNVLSLDIEGKDKEAFNIKEAYCDLTELGGLGKVSIDNKLKELSIAVRKDIDKGKKNIPITVIDEFNNEYTTAVSVDVVDRDKKDNDFDWDEAVIYFMLTDRFFDGNSANNDANGKQTYGDNPGLYHGGDMAGITKKLDYLSDLGVNTLWISPIVENIQGVDNKDSKDVPYVASYHGYWASDFTKLNPAFGTEEEFRTLIEQAHKKNIKIMVDVVLNHAGYGTEDKFGPLLRTNEETVLGDDRLSPSSGLPDFVTEKDNVREQLIEWQTAWMKNFDIDYYRVDTVKHVDNTTWSAFKNALTKEKPEFKLIGEQYGAGYANTAGQLNTGRMDSLLDFDINDKASSFVKGDITNVEKFFEERNKNINNTAMMGQFIGSHDETGFMQGLIDSGMDKEGAYAKTMVAASLQMTSKGQPVIYYGEEVGMTGKDNYPYNDNRYDMDFSLAKDSNKMYSHYKTLLKTRNSFKDVFVNGTRKTIEDNDKEGYLLFERKYNDESLIIGLNTNDKEQKIKLKSLQKKTEYVDIYSGKTYKTDKNGNVSITMPKSSNGGTVLLSTKKDVDNKKLTPANQSKNDNESIITKVKTQFTKIPQFFSGIVNSIKQFFKGLFN